MASPSSARTVPTTTYLARVEPTPGWTDIQALADEARRAAVVLVARGRSVRFLRVLVVPEDGACFLVVEATDRWGVRELGRLVGIGLARPVPAVSDAVRRPLGQRAQEGE